MPAAQTQLGTASGALPAQFISSEELQHQDLSKQEAELKIPGVEGNKISHLGTRIKNSQIN